MFKRCNITPCLEWKTEVQAEESSQELYISEKRLVARQHAGTTKNRHWLSLPGPVCFKEGRVIHNGGQQSREAPQQQGGEELGDDGVL